MNLTNGIELWDAYHKDFKLVNGVTLLRGAPLPKGIYHLVCGILVQHVDGTYLITQRDYRKMFGGMWEASAGGSALQGETALVSARRELFEETGIHSDNLIELGRSSSDIYQSLYVDFLCTVDCPKDSIVLQSGETIDYRWVTKDELASMSKDKLLTKRLREYLFSA